ncbi:MAG TPA: ATP synthase subunit I [Coleofasciculaceae cyanobacterium]
MNDLILLALALATGIGLGLIYFGGLWLTVCQLSKTRYPLLLTLSSLVGRMSISLFGLYFVLTSKHSDWVILHLLSCLLMVFWIRNLLLWQLQPHPRRIEAIRK